MVAPEVAMAVKLATAVDMAVLAMEVATTKAMELATIKAITKATAVGTAAEAMAAGLHMVKSGTKQAELLEKYVS